MASNDLYSGGEIPPDVRELLQQFDSLQQQIDRQRFQKDAGSNRELMGMATGTLSRAALKARNDTIAALEAHKLQIWEQLRRLDPLLAADDTGMASAGSLGCVSLLLRDGFGGAGTDG
ncbi:MAG: hypothetical protein KME26_32295 [Oscillatoria princeps RMCB-10]|jgi:hypothetical protein|nr:hypothetical protein [Oscillatoria princeps RMCB-10]